MGVVGYLCSKLNCWVEVVCIHEEFFQCLSAMCLLHVYIIYEPEPRKWFQAHRLKKLFYPPELQLNKANISDTEAPFLDLHLSVANGFVSSKIYDKRDDFDFDIVNFPFLDGDVPRRASYGVYISQLIRFARDCNHVTDFIARNKCLTAKLLQQGYRYHKLRNNLF